MVKKSSKSAPKAKATRRPDVIQPESWTGYPAKAKCNCPVTTLGKTVGGGKSAA